MSRIKVFYLLIGLTQLFYRECWCVSLSVTPVPRQLTVRLGDQVNLLCNSNQRPSICLWKTPYQSIYTVGGGRTWENGRLGSNAVATSNQCGITIRGVSSIDVGAWECEVGAVVDGEFTTTTATTNINIIQHSGSGGEESALSGVEGEEMTLECGGGGEDCSWSTPYSRTYRLLQGEYAERGRIQAVGGCSVRVASLQTRDQGQWTCQYNQGSTTNQFRTNLTIEIPLKLSSPTSILQQSDEKATLVCHANKQLDTCQWETPYHTIVSMTDRTVVHEGGRLRYFGFSDMDCGIVIQGVNPVDSGGWTCRVTASVAGNHQISTDIVRLFVEPTEPASPPVKKEEEEVKEDYPLLQYNDDKHHDYDAFDYVNGDFDKVKPDAQAATKAPETRFKGVPAVPSSSGSPKGFPAVPSSSGAPPTLFTTPAPTTLAPLISRTVEETDGFVRDIQRFGKFGTVRIDRVKDNTPSRGQSSTSPRGSSSSTSSRGQSSSTSRGSAALGPSVERTREETPRSLNTGSKASDGPNSFPALSFNQDGEEKEDKGGKEKGETEDDEITGDLNSSELDFLALISGSRVDNRPFSLQNDSSFGTRQSSSSGSRFQFGNVHLEIEDNISSTSNKPETTTTPTTTPTIDNTETNAENRRIQLMKQEQDMLQRRRNQAEQKRREESDSKRREQVQDRRRKENEDRRAEMEAKRREEIEAKRREDIEAKRREEIILVRQREEAEAARRKELDDKRRDELESARRREELETKRREHIREQMSKRREEEAKANNEHTDRIRISSAKESEGGGSSDSKEEPNRTVVRQRVRTRPGDNSATDSQVSSDSDRTDRIELVRAQEEEARRLQEVRAQEEEVRRLQEVRAQEEEARRLQEVRAQEEEARRLQVVRAQEEAKRQEADYAKNKQIEDQRRLRKEQEKQDDQEQAIQKLLEAKAIEEGERLRKIEEEKLKRLKEEQEKILKKAEKKRQEEREQIIREEREKIRKELEEKRRRELLEQREKELKEEREKKLMEELERRRIKERERIRIEQIRQKQEEDRQRELDAKREQKMKEERERELALERERARKEQEALQRKLLADEQRKLDEHKMKIKEERDRAEERRRKEEEELKLIKAREEKRREEILRLRRLQAERDKSLREERVKLRMEIELQKKKEEEELSNIREREEQRRKDLKELLELQEEQERLLNDERDRLQKQSTRNREREEEDAKRKVERDRRRQEIELLKEQQRLREQKLKAEREKIEREKEKLAQEQEELRRQKELLDRIRAEQATSTTSAPTLKPTAPAQQQRICLISPWPSDGNITCPSSVSARGNLIVKTGNKCRLDCNPGFVSLDARETECRDGVWSKELVCVKPGAMLVVGGRSDTYGVLSSVELITSGGVCRNAVPSLPAMRWKSVAASLDTHTVVVCGGINFLGDPKTDCWRLMFPGPEERDEQPSWGAMSSLQVPRDAAAWAAEGGKLYVMGGSLGPLSGYTASVEIYNPDIDSWSAGPSLPSDRASHCAVGLGNGSIIVTGGYGALGNVLRLDIQSGVWTELPSLNPLRAQHGCGLVEVEGRKGVLVVGGDSGGKRLNDVRFLGLGSTAEWVKISDLNTARWGRPSVGIIGGKITVVGGWDGLKALSTVEYYDERTQTWISSRTRLSTERRWAAAAQISNSLFPRCVQKRQ